MSNDTREAVGEFEFVGTRWERDDPDGDGPVVVRRGDIVTVYDDEYPVVSDQLVPTGNPDADDEDSDAEDEFDPVEFGDRHYKERESAVLDGDVDDYLDVIAENDESQTVIDAVDERRAEIDSDTE